MERPAIIAVKTIHTGVFVVVASAIVYLFHSGVRGRTDSRAAAAGSVVAGEALIFVASGWRCPLTGFAERLGAADGSVADIYLPRWVAAHIPEITVPLVAAACALHVANLVSRARAGSARRVTTRKGGLDAEVPCLGGYSGAGSSRRRCDDPGRW